MASEADKDPWQWTVDEVVDALCQSKDVYDEAGCTNARLPDLTALSQHLRIEQVDGLTLLTGIDSGILKDDFEIKVLGHRRALLETIKYLQSKSAIYRQKHPGEFSFGSGFQTPGSGYNPGRGLSQFPQLYFHNAFPAKVEEAPEPNPMRQFVPTLVVSDAATGSGLNADVDRPTLDLDMLAEPHSEPVVNARSGENIVVDESGRKRRRLNNLVPVDNAEQTSLQSPIQRIYSPQGGLPNSLIAPLEVRRNDLSQRRLATVPGYRSTGSFPVKDIFFRAGIHDQDIDEDEEFSFVANSVHPGEVKRYVYRQMSHFLRNSELEDVERDGRPAIAIYPYRKGLDNSEGPRSAILVYHQGDEIVARPETHTPPNDNPALEGAKTGHEWDFLQHWVDDPGEELRPYGESGSEISCSSSFLEQLEAEERDREDERQDNGGPMKRSQVAEAVDKAIAGFREDWRKKKLPLRENGAWTIWRKGRKSRAKRLLLEDAKARIGHLNQKLDDYKNEITGQIWLKEKEVIQQCLILEEFVYQREDQAWRASVWQRNDAPPRPVVKPKTRVKVVDKLQGDEEVLSSEVAASEDINDFVDVDDADMRQGAVASPQSDPESPSPEPKSSQASHKKSTPRQTAPTTPTANEIDDRVELDQDDDTANEMDMAMEGDNISLDDDLPTAVAATRSTATVSPAKNHIIDLTLSGDESTPGNTPVTPRGYPMSEWFKGDPEQARRDMIASWEMGVLEERSDRKRIIVKILNEVDTKDLEVMKTRIKILREREFLDEMKRGIQCYINGEAKLSGVSKADTRKIVMFSRLYLCWYYANSQWWTERVSKEFPSNKYNDGHQFYEFLRAVLLGSDGTHTNGELRTPTKTQKKKMANHELPINVSSAPRSESDESDEPISVSTTPHKGRKRAVAQSQVAMHKRETAQLRRQEQERFEEQLGYSQGGQEPSIDAIMINTSKLDEHGPVFLNKFIAAKIKKHQVEGVRFMWREIVTAASSGSQGCLLAHTMGLGKTMQAITLLVTIAEAANSTDPAINAQIPEELRDCRALILCPAALINNWIEELDMWIPPLAKRLVGKRRALSAETLFEQRIEDIESWYKTGGILVVSYEMLRNLVDNKPTKPGAEPRLDGKEHDMLLTHLLEGPHMIIADEAHVIKNPEAGISKVCSRFVTKSRIALTGSPLANHLLEYHAMIDWVSPGYLGGQTEFKAHYQEPIHGGLWGDSEHHTARTALKLLRILKNEIEPKVNRADITVLKGSLKPKVEFVIKVPLTKLQEEAYRAYVESIFRGPTAAGDITRAKVWSWVAVLVLLCSHPQIYFEKLLGLLKGAGPKKRAKAKVTAPANRAPSPADPALLNVVNDDGTGEDGTHAFEVDVEDISVGSLQTRGMIEEQRAIYERVKEIGDLGSMEHSFKMLAVQKIIQYCKEIGDRVLIFSHSLPILNFLEKFCEDSGTACQRIDGSVNASKRQALAQAFNKGTNLATAFLISTKAGGIGLNLPGANRVIILDINYNPTWEEQAIGRAYRIGQEKPVFVYRFLTAGTFEIPIYNQAVFKTQLSYRAVDKKNVKPAAFKEIDLLKLPEQVKQENLEPFKGKDPQVLDRIIGQTGESWIRSITTTETLREEIAEDFTKAELDEIRQMEYREKLKRSDPEKWKLLMAEDAEKRAKAFQEARQREHENALAAGRPPQMHPLADGVPHGARLVPTMISLTHQPSAATHPMRLINPPSGYIADGLPTLSGIRSTSASSYLHNGHGQSTTIGGLLDHPASLPMGSSAPPPNGLPSARAGLWSSSLPPRQPSTHPEFPPTIHEISSTDDEAMNSPEEPGQTVKEGSSTNKDRVNNDALLHLRMAIKSDRTPLLCTTADPRKSSHGTNDMAIATHLSVSYDSQSRVFPLDAPTRFPTTANPLSLRSVMFAYFRQKDTQRVYEEAVEQLQQKFLEPKGRRLVIGNLPHAATQSDLKQFFKDYEFISAVHPNNHDGRSAGHAVVDVLTYAYAKRAVRDLDGGRLGDRRVSVRLAPSSHIQGGSGNAGANIQKIDESMRLKLIAWLRGEGEQNEDLNIRESNASSTKDSAGQPTGDAVEQNRSPHIARDSRSKDAHQSDPEERYNFNERMKLRFGTTEPSSS